MSRALHCSVFVMKFHCVICFLLGNSPASEFLKTDVSEPSIGFIFKGLEDGTDSYVPLYHMNR